MNQTSTSHKKQNVVYMCWSIFEAGTVLVNGKVYTKLPGLSWNLHWLQIVYLNENANKIF
jgi:hypothetical protein